MFDRDQPGWRIVRRIPIMGPEEHGGHCELEFDGLEIPDDSRLMNVGDGLKVTQIRLGTARLTHCMRWLGLARRSMDIAAEYVSQRVSGGSPLAGQRPTASVNASCTASSATSMSPKVRTRTATARPYSSRKTRSISDAAGPDPRGASVTP